MELLSVAASTMTLLDSLWKSGELTAELISNFRGSDKVSSIQDSSQGSWGAPVDSNQFAEDLTEHQDARLLEAKIRDETSRAKYTKHLLFDASTIYNGKTLFDQFDPDVQNQIQIFFEESSDILSQALRVLHRLLGNYDPAKAAGSVSTSSSTLWSSMLRIEPTSSNAMPSTSQNTMETSCRSPSPLKRFWWSVHDKKRVETIVGHLSELNDRIQRNIQLWCLGAELGVDRMQHLKRLENDPNSKALGFDIDARLQISTINGLGIPETLEISDSRVLQGTQKILNGRFGITKWEERPVLIEYRRYAPESPIPVELDERTRVVIDRLAKILHQPKEMVFRMPNCLGWTCQMQQNRVAFLFAVPDGVQPSPISLLQLLTSTSHAPPLGVRFHLALRLAQCISQLQLVKWVHESFRSDNILFYTRPEASQIAKAADNKLLKENVDLTEPWVFGFENSRPDPFFSAGLPDICPERDIYRHPSRQQMPTQQFSKVHDIYALGVVLLEIGLWQEALDMEKSRFSKIRDPMVIKKQLVKNAEKRLASKMGTKYKDVVIRCLEGGFNVINDTKEELKLQQAFRLQVVDVLELSSQNI